MIKLYDYPVNIFISYKNTGGFIEGFLMPHNNTNERDFILSMVAPIDFPTVEENHIFATARFHFRDRNDNTLLYKVYNKDRWLWNKTNG